MATDRKAHILIHTIYTSCLFKLRLHWTYQGDYPLRCYRPSPPFLCNTLWHSQRFVVHFRFYLYTVSIWIISLKQDVLCTTVQLRICKSSPAHCSGCKVNLPHTLCILGTKTTQSVNIFITNKNFCPKECTIPEKRLILRILQKALAGSEMCVSHKSGLIFAFFRIWTCEYLMYPCMQLKCDW